LVKLVFLLIDYLLLFFYCIYHYTSSPPVTAALVFQTINAVAGEVPGVAVDVFESDTLGISILLSIAVTSSLALALGVLVPVPTLFCADE
jgi:hypothetical protein